MKLNLSLLVLITVILGIGPAVAFAQKGEKKAAPYKITNIKIVPFNEQTGAFEDEITDKSERAFYNELSTSLFVTFQVSGEAGSFEAGRNIVITVTEGKKIKYSKTEQVGLIGSDGSYYIPAYLYGSMCSDVKITAKLTGQKTVSTMTRRVPFLCGE
ncbi:MAG: hypothetical protein ABJA02_02010 [Acidobacteriota bacterium]